MTGFIVDTAPTQTRGVRGRPMLQSSRQSLLERATYAFFPFPFLPLLSLLFCNVKDGV